MGSSLIAKGGNSPANSYSLTISDILEFSTVVDLRSVRLISRLIVLKTRPTTNQLSQCHKSFTDRRVGYCGEKSFLSAKKTGFQTMTRLTLLLSALATMNKITLSWLVNYLFTMTGHSVEYAYQRKGVMLIWDACSAHAAVVVPCKCVMYKCPRPNCKISI